MHRDDDPPGIGAERIVCFLAGTLLC